MREHLYISIGPVIANQSAFSRSLQVAAGWYVAARRMIRRLFSPAVCSIQLSVSLLNQPATVSSDRRVTHTAQLYISGRPAVLPPLPPGTVHKKADSDQQLVARICLIKATQPAGPVGSISKPTPFCIEPRYGRGGVGQHMARAGGGGGGPSVQIQRK